MGKIRTGSLLLVMLLVLAACGKLPDPPGAEQVSRDVQALATSVFIGEVQGSGERHTLTDIIVEEMDIAWVDNDDEDTLAAEITAFIGDEAWRSEVRQTVVVTYVLNASRQWQAQGIAVDAPVIPVIPRA